MRAKEMGDLHWTEVRLPATSDKHGVGEIDLAPFRTKEKREKAIPLSGMAVDIFRKIERRPDDLCVFGRGDGRPIVLDGVPVEGGAVPRRYGAQDYETPKAREHQFLEAVKSIRNRKSVSNIDLPAATHLFDANKD